MSKRDPLYQELFPNGQLHWPEGEAGDAMAEKLFGAILVACVDTKIAEADRLISNTPKEHEGDENVALRLQLAQLSDEQKRAVGELVRKIATDVFYGMCVKMDQFPGADVEIALIEPGGKRHLVAAPTQAELQSRYFTWIEQFSDA